jgi:hypothetical protein
VTKDNCDLMRKLRPDSVGVTDLEEYLREFSDFAFELRVLKMLRDLKVECEHGGLYEDPVTKKSREFDIRAIRTVGNDSLRMPIECKNVRENFPLLISCVPRHSDESYHSVAVVREPTGHMYRPAVFESRAQVVRLEGDQSVYKPGEPVGKSIAQVGRRNDGSLIANDSEFHKKWGQCLASAHDLLDQMYYEGDDDDSDEVHLGSVIPFVVVPDDMLWIAVYDDTGNLVRRPERATRCSCFVGKHYYMGSNISGAGFVVSHIEVVTISGLQSFVSNSLGTEAFYEQVFPTDAVVNALHSQHVD